MIDIQTEPIKNLPGLNTSNIWVFDSKYRNSYEIPASASPTQTNHNFCNFFEWNLTSFITISDQIVMYKA